MNVLVLPLGIASLMLGALVALQMLQAATEDRRGVARSLSFITAQSTGLNASKVGRQSFQQRVLLPALARCTALGHRLTPAGASTRLVTQLDLAGNPATWTLDRLLAVKAVGAVSGPAVGILLLGSGARSQALLATAFLSGVGFFLPNVLTYNAGIKRQAEIQKTLPDALDLLTISVEAGMGFDAALHHVGQNTTGPLRGEFFRVLQEMQMKSRSDAFRALGERTTVSDLRTFVSSLVQADALGIPIARVLREQAKEMRLKRRQRAEEKAMKVPVKVLFPMVVCILPVLFVIVLAPAFIELAGTLKGV